MILSPSKLVSGWQLVGIKGLGKHPTLLLRRSFLQANREKVKVPTSGFEPLT
jgi:hypothetical protein